MRDEELRRAHAAAALGLPRHQLGVALGNARAPAAARLEIRGCYCRHLSSPLFLLSGFYCLSAALNFALRERGLRSCSSSPAMTGFLVNAFQIPCCVPSRILSFAMRSSRE